MRSISTGLAITTLVVAACSGESAQQRNMPTVRRGDTLVVLVGAPMHPRGGDLVTDWTIGGPDASSETAFSFVAEVAIGSDGAVFVNEFGGTAPPMRRFDRAGRFARTIGGRGQGPGEYLFATGVKELRDGRVAVRDMPRRLIHLYAPSGEPDTTWRFPTIIGACGGAHTLLTDTAGFVYVRDGQCPRGNRPVFDGLIRLGARGVLVDSIPMPNLGYVQPTVTIPGRGEIGAASIPVPFAPRALAVWSPLGYFVTGIPTRYAIDLRIPPSSGGVTAIPAARGAERQRASQWVIGNEVLSLRRALSPIPVERAEREEQEAIVTARGRQRNPRWDWDASLIPPTKPIYRALHVGEDGRIWVLLSSPATRIELPPDAGARGEFRDAPPGPLARWVEPDVYDILEPDGRYVGQVEMPRGVELHATRGDTLWVSSRLADDVPIVQRVHIVWR